MSCSRYDNGKCASAWCYYKSAGDTCLNPRLKRNQRNADRIRGMSDEELAEFLGNMSGDKCGGVARMMLDWLRQPAETNEKEIP